jgi:hypothetical protein
MMRKEHVYHAESYGADSIEQIKKDAATMLDIFAQTGEENMICVITGQKALDGTYRVAAITISDLDAEEIIIEDGVIDKFIIQGRE